MPHQDTQDQGRAANPGYAAFQIARALSTSETHGDAATRERAREKVSKWVRVLEGMLSGELNVGSRQPMQDVPVWATPEVVTGGFVTGGLLAGGLLLPYESALAERVAPGSAEHARQVINAYFLSAAGIEELTDLLRSGCYDVRIPEDGALLAMAWLVTHGHSDDARALVDQLAPHFSTLRFYPVPADRAAEFGPRIFLESVGEVRERIQHIKPNPRIMAERESIQIWTPLYDRMIQLFQESVSGELPTIRPDSDGRWISPLTRRFNITGGWPCRHYAVDWRKRAALVLAEIETARATHKLCRKPEQAGDSFSRLRGYLERCAGAPESLTGRDVGMIRLILARHLAKRGTPQSDKLRCIRERQRAQTAGPTHHQIAVVIQERLALRPSEGGLEDLENVLQPVTADEATKSSLPPGAPVPSSIGQKVARCLCDTADVLVAHGIVTSGETLARIIPQFTSGLRSHAFDDPQLRTLYASLYRAFRRRRSLLLLNLENQVRVEELPWVAVVEQFRRKDVSARDLSRQTLKDVAMLTLRAFPHALLPNKLLQEFRALAKGGELDLPFVEELAADIFMDDFSPKFTQAAKRAAASIEGTLYARYYNVDCAAVRCLPEAKAEPKRRSWFQRETPTNPFADICIARAGAAESKALNVARNGMVIEQAQIVTTHNLALLFETFNLAAELQPNLPAMARQCFRWICRRQQTKSDKWHAKLIMLKNTAYAWRQMVFYLSHLPQAEVGTFIAWAETHVRGQTADFQTRFAPAMLGLAMTHEGAPPDAASDARCFLGWTQKRHWLLGEEPPRPAPR